MDDILKAALRERDALQAQLAAHPAFKRLRAVEQIIELYGQSVGMDQSVRPQTQARVAAPRRGSKTQQILSATAEYLRFKGARAQSGELVEMLGRNGIDVGGKKPSATLASYLSHSGQFDNKPREGYGLKEWNGQSGPVTNAIIGGLVPSGPNTLFAEITRK